MQIVSMQTAVKGHCHVRITFFWQQVNTPSSFIIAYNRHQKHLERLCTSELFFFDTILQLFTQSPYTYVFTQYRYLSRQSSITLHHTAPIPLFMHQIYLWCYEGIEADVKYSICAFKWEQCELVST